MNNKEFITEVAAKIAVTPAQCQKMVNELADTLSNTLEMDNEVVVAGLGSFETKQKKERVMVNPATGNKMLVPPKIVINFKMSSTYKNKIN
ncbi:MAG: HU family DNA-binding protein [Prevotellaceae bacterium]|nr:HU family DNA-binding protein [Prevotellaceae bacterium]